jgi:hypothetical protein
MSRVGLPPRKDHPVLRSAVRDSFDILSLTPCIENIGASESFKSASVAILGATACPRGSCASLAVSWKLATERSGRPTHLASMHFSFSPEFKPNCLIYKSCIGLSKPVLEINERYASN